MTSSRIQKGARQRLKLRAAIDGPSGSGKSFTALRFAHALGKKIGIVESESGASQLYVGESPDGTPFEFDIIQLASFSPSEYTAAIQEFGREGYDVIIVDSLSHAWEGQDGALELVNKTKSGNKYTAWNDVTPMHRRMIEAMKTSPAHVIATMRSKTDYVLEKDEKGKSVPVKVGMAPIQRPGMEYEFDLYCSLDWSHIMTVTKSRCSALDGLIVAKPGAPFMAPVIEWLNGGIVTAPTVLPPARIGDQQAQQIAERLLALGWNADRLEKDLPKKFGCTQIHQLTREQADGLIRWLDGQVAAKDKRTRRTEPAAAPAEQSANGTATNGHAALAPAPVSAPAPAPAAPPPSEGHSVNAPKVTDDPAALAHLLKARQRYLAAAGLRVDAPKDSPERAAADAAWKAVLASRCGGVSSAKDLTTLQADALLAWLNRESEDLEAKKGGVPAAAAVTFP